METELSRPGKMKKKKKTGGKRKFSEISTELNTESLNGMPWRSSITDNELDSFFHGVEGGFLSLEEIDESGYDGGHTETIGSDGTVLQSKKRKRALKSNKTDKRGELTKEAETNESDQAGELTKQIASPSSSKNNLKTKKKGKKKKKKETTKMMLNTVETTSHVEASHDEKMHAGPDLTGTEDHNSEQSFDMDKFSAWRELRLHPFLEKAICELGFLEPTPIQKCCIPAAAYQGKDVVGAAETGSGKTLAFGLPILQRLLEEREKEAHKEGLEDNMKETFHKNVDNSLRALILAPTRELALQVCEHLKAVSRHAHIKVVPIVGGMAPEKQERLLKQKPHVVVGTPGRIWQLMSAGEKHLLELYSLSFFVLDEADRMIEKGHFQELQSIIGMLPLNNVSTTDDGMQKMSKMKKRQTLVFSATIALSSGFRKKLRRASHPSKSGQTTVTDSLEALCERAGVRENAAVFDLTSSSIVAHKLEESVIECKEEDKDAYLYYILRVHGCGRTIVFCTSIAAVRRISAILGILKVSARPLHAQMQQRARLKAMDCFKQHEDSVLVATDVAARGLDIPGVRTVIHYQLPHSAEVYIHRSGRTARASAEGCSVALISPGDRSKYVSLCHTFSKDQYRSFPVNLSYMREVEKRVSLARQLDRILRLNSKTKANKSWFERMAGALEIDIDVNDSDEEQINTSKSRKKELVRANQLQKELDQMLLRPLQPRTLSHRFVAGAGMSTLLQQQLQEFTKQKSMSGEISNANKQKNLLVIGQEAIEPLSALRNSKL